ncbi:MAG: histone deacetylase family protein [Emcibacteraceae bacterium]|nr:histone deacetylase family protein [Emcibacteraceae bacterium]
MKCVLAEEQKEHYPKSFLVNGIRQPNPEMPERIDILRQGAIDARLEIIKPDQYDMARIEEIHSDRYLTFLQNAYKRWSRIPGAAAEVTPNIHPTSRNDGYPASVVAQAGYHMTDASAPISDSTWNSALWSAWSAQHASELILSGENMAYALCRPPGHHASADMAGGFCYFNNTAIATQNLLKKYKTAAILDVDLHHGNGTQSIFYQRNDVFTLSLHADPTRFYPFFWGYENEAGEGVGEGFNTNYPLARGSGDDVFLEKLDLALDKIADFNPGILIIALGLDAFEGDPFGGLTITTKGYEMIAQKITRKTTCPILIVQEGGYLCDELGENLTRFLNGIQG